MTNYDLIHMKSRNGQHFEVRCVGIYRNDLNGYQQVTCAEDEALCNEVVWGLYGADPDQLLMHIEDFPTREKAVELMKVHVKHFDAMHNSRRPR